MHDIPFRPSELKPTGNNEVDPDPGLCEDTHERCADWAAAGECDRNKAYMVRAGQGRAAAA